MCRQHSTCCNTRLPLVVLVHVVTCAYSTNPLTKPILTCISTSHNYAHFIFITT